MKTELDVAFFLFLLEVVALVYVLWILRMRAKAIPLMQARKRAIDQHKERLAVYYKTYLQAEDRSPFGAADPKLKFMRAHYMSLCEYVNSHIEKYNEDVRRLNSLLPWKS